MPRIDISNDRPRPNWRPVRKHHPDGPATLHDDLTDFAADGDAHAMLAGCFRHCLRDCPHAADCMTPHAALTIYLPEQVVQQHISRTLGVGAREVSHDSIETEHRLYWIGVEPAVQNLSGRFAKQTESRFKGTGLPQVFSDAKKTLDFAPSSLDAV